MKDEGTARTGYAAWPAIPYAPWAGTCAALHLWTQILGKHRLAHTPWVNHSWHATLTVTPRGLTTGPVPDPGGLMALTLDLVDHALVAEGPGGARGGFALGPMSVADFVARSRGAVEGVGGTFAIHGRPNEVPERRALRARIRPSGPTTARRWSASTQHSSGSCR